jgi:hypothetical protein
MSVKIQCPDLPRVNRELPIYAALPPTWTPDKVARLAARFDMKGEVADAGAWYVCRNESSALEVYQASHSLRIERLDIDAEGRHLVLDPPDRERALETAKRVMAMIGDDYARPDVHSVTELTVLKATRDKREGERKVVGLQVNYRYTLDGMPLVGPGAKAQVTVAADGEMMQAYRFARAVERIGARTSVDPEDDAPLRRKRGDGSVGRARQGHRELGGTGAAVHPADRGAERARAHLRAARRGQHRAAAALRVHRLRGGHRARRGRCQAQALAAGAAESADGLNPTSGFTSHTRARHAATPALPTESRHKARDLP